METTMTMLITQGQRAQPLANGAMFDNEQEDPGRLDWFTSGVLPDGGQRVRICRCARSTPTGAVELDRGTSALLLAVLGELARVDPAVSWPAARQAVLRAFHARSVLNP